MNARIAYRHLVDHGGGADHVVLFLRVLSHVVVHPGGLATAGQTDHHDHLTGLSAGHARIASDSISLIHHPDLQILSSQSILPVLLVRGGLVDPKVDLKLDIPGHDVRKQSSLAEIILRDLEGVALVFAVLGEGDVDLTLSEVDESSDDVAFLELLAVVFELLVVGHFPLAGGITPGQRILSQHEGGGVGGPSHPQVVGRRLLVYLDVHVVDVLHLVPDLAGGEAEGCSGRSIAVSPAVPGEGNSLTESVQDPQVEVRVVPECKVLV